MQQFWLGRTHVHFAAILVITLAVAGLVLTPMASAVEKPTWTIRGQILAEKVIVQAHRGAGELAPENTLEAFELGWKLGCYPECDLRMTKDGVIVTFHDGDFSRVVKGVAEEMKKKGVADVTWAQLSTMDVGAWQGEEFTGRRVSTIGQAFERMQGKPEQHLYMDIKNVNLEQLAGEVKRYNVGPQVILASTKYAQIREWKRLVPDGPKLLWMGGSDETLGKRFDEIRKTNFADITQLQVHAHLKKDLKDLNQSSVDPF